MRITKHTSNIANENGEIISTSDNITNEYNIKNEEPEFLKLYIKTIVCFLEAPASVQPLFFELVRRFNFRDNSVVVDRAVRLEIAEQLNCSIVTINRQVTDLVKYGLIANCIGKTNGKVRRGVYMINPYIICSGNWKTVKNIRTEFDFAAGTFMSEFEKAVAGTSDTEKLKEEWNRIIANKKNEKPVLN
jgi:predicted transcriptional regulator